jgi:hypothetical protein
MKKFISVLITAICLFGLVSCKVVDETKEPLEPEELNEPIDNTTFEDYLSKTLNTLNIEKFNKLFPKKINTDIISDFKMPNANVTFETNGFEKLEKYNEQNLFLWQEENILYSYSEANEELFFLDLLEAENLIANELNELDGLGLSNILELLIKKIANTNNISFTTLLEEINLTSNDFESKDNNAYVLKRETISRMIVAISNNTISIEKASKILDNYFDKFFVILTYKNGKIRDIGVILEVNFQNSFELKTSLSIKFQYDGSKLLKVDFGINLSVNYLSGDKNDLIVTTYGYILENETNLHIKLIKDEITEISFILSKNSYQLEFIETDKETNLNKEFKINLLMEEDVISVLDVLYSIDQGRNEKNIKIHFSKNLEMDIPEIQIEDAVSILDYLIDDELKEN